MRGPSEVLAILRSPSGRRRAERLPARVDSEAQELPTVAATTEDGAEMTRKVELTIEVPPGSGKSVMYPETDEHGEPRGLFVVVFDKVSREAVALLPTDEWFSERVFHRGRVLDGTAAPEVVKLPDWFQVDTDPVFISALRDWVEGAVNATELVSLGGQTMES